MNVDRVLRYSLETSYFIGSLPVGCRLCMAGKKTVLFITGLCRDKCWYCPVSRRKLGRDVIFVNEHRVNNLYTIVDEVYKSGSRGIGVTGGDPLIVIDRTCNIISLLKREFGEDFHIHLYTSGSRANKKVYECLESAGLDEIRFHVYKPSLIQKAVEALDYSFDVGIEVPFIPLDEYILFLKRLVRIADEEGIGFININEFEVSESNVYKVELHGLKPTGLTVEGIHDKAIEFLEWARRNTRRVNIHYCIIEFKDKVQYRLRMMHRALNTLGLHEVPTRDGTVISIELLSGNVTSEDVYNIDGKRYIGPYKVYLYKGSGVEGFILEYYPVGETILNKRFVKY